MKIEAVIFDLDGLMIESERFHFDILERLLASHGKQASEAWFEPMIGMDNIECAEYVIKETNLPLTPEAYIQEKYALMLDLLPEVSKPNPGLLDLLQDLKDADLKLGVASNSFRVYVKIALEALGIMDSFGCVLSADDVENAKPAPDLYLLAAKRLCVAPENCLVLEDSPHGMMAALEAGMSCAMIPNPHLKDENFDGATFVFSSLVELRQSLPMILSNGKL
jgi:HAD superfamily hydrolase (TIGR01509 family)